MKVFLGSIFAQLILNPYVFWRGWQALPAKKACRVPYLALFILELAVFFTGFFFHDDLPDGIMIPIMYICGTWYIALLYLTMALLALELVRLWGKFRPWFLAVAFLAVAGLMVKGYYNVVNPVVRHVDIHIPKQAGGRDSLTVVMMTDLHIGEVIGREQVRKFVSMSNAQRPDMVVLVGDLVDYEVRFAEAIHADADLRLLKAPLGVYAVYGNHEYRANRFAKTRWIKRTGAELLVDTTLLIDNSFYLIGRDDYINPQRQPLHHIMKGVDKRKPAILLDHQPWTFAEAAMNGVDLGLYGHTHNGQVWPYPLLLKFIYECPFGYYRKGTSQFYVSSGIGIAGPPFRVGTVSELVVLHIRFN